MATWMVPISIDKLNIRRIPIVGKFLPKAMPIIPIVIPATNTLHDREYTTVPKLLIPKKPKMNPGAINTAVKIKIGIIFF